MKNRSSGFTIIELIVVMTIILILAGLITGAGQTAKRRAMITQTKAMISGLETALAMFQTDLGGYPDGTGSTANLVTTLTTAGGTYFTNTSGIPVNTVAGWSGPYMNFKQGEVVSGTVRDAWGTAMNYDNASVNRNHTAAGGPDNTTYLDIWSNGPNKTNDNQTSDDITNWSR